jgi:hypothetical protein
MFSLALIESVNFFSRMLFVEESLCADSFSALSVTGAGLVFVVWIVFSGINMRYLGTVTSMVEKQSQLTYLQVCN